MSRRASAGFTLLEVLVALALVAGALTSAVVVFNRHLGLLAAERDETTALLLCRAKLDEPDFLSASKADGSFAPDRPDMTWKRQETPSEFPGVRRYTVTVAWQQGRRSLTLVSYDRK